MSNKKIIDKKCIHCGKDYETDSDPKWTVSSKDEKIFYHCPECMKRIEKDSTPLEEWFSN